MVHIIKDNLIIINIMELVGILLLMEVIIKEISYMDFRMDKDNSIL